MHVVRDNHILKFFLKLFFPKWNYRFPNAGKRNNIKRKLEEDVKKTQEKQDLQTKVVIVDIKWDRNEPECESADQNLFWNLMPFNNGSFWEPVEVMIRIGKSYKAHDHKARVSGKNLFDIGELSHIKIINKLVV